VVARYRRILCRIIELRQEHARRRIFRSSYRPPDASAIATGSWFQFLADTRPNSPSNAARRCRAFCQMPRRVLNGQDDKVSIPQHRAAIFRAHSSSLNDGSSHTL